MSTRKPVEIIALARQNGWPEKDLTFKEMRRLVPYHKIDDHKRLKQVMKQVKLGKYEPIILSADDPPIIIDGNMRWKAAKKLRIGIRVIVSPWTKWWIQQVEKFRDKGILEPAMEGNDPVPTLEQVERVSKEMGL